jgi:hypothetical protein
MPWTLLSLHNPHLSFLFAAGWLVFYFRYCMGIDEVLGWLANKRRINPRSFR